MTFRVGPNKDVPMWAWALHRDHESDGRSEIKCIGPSGFDPRKHCSTCKKAVEDGGFSMVDAPPSAPG